jgi:hypothetical protein
MAPSDDRPVVARLRSGAPLAGWLLKANPARWDVLGHLAEHGTIGSWRMVPTYRAELMAPGHPCVLWVTGGGPWTSGLWAAGVVTMPARDSGDGRLVIGLRLEGLPSPVAREDLAADPRFAAAEVLRQPRMGNPLALTPEELDAVEDHLP